MSENLKEEEKYLHKVFHSNGYDNATIRAGSKELPSKIIQILSKRKVIFLLFHT